MKRLLLAALGLLAACGAPPQAPVVQRFVDPAPNEPFRTGTVLASQTVFAWDLTEPGEARRWRAAGGRSTEPGRWSLEGDEEELLLTRAVDLSASEVHALDVELVSFRGGAELCWAAAGEGFAAERCEPCAPQPRRTRRGRVYRCAVGRQPQWAGAPDRLQLRLRPERGGRVRIRRISGIRQRLRSKPFAAALGRSWLLVLDGTDHRETRTGFLAPPGIDLERRLDLPPGALLRFGYGLQPGVREPVTFRAEVRPAAGAAETVFEHTLRSADVGRGSPWRDAEVDLSRFAGRQVEIVLRTEAAATFDPVRGLPLWAHPEVIGRAPAPAPPNVLLISADTLRADRLSLYGYGRPTSPHLDAWAEACGVTFDTAVASSPWTLPSHTTLFTGLDALTHGVNYPVPVPDAFTTLAERLRAAGYSTYAVTGGGYLSPHYGLAQGFDRFLRWGDQPRASRELEAGIAAAQKILAAHRQGPFFLFLHTYETHTPYRPRQPYLSALRGEEPREYPRPVSERNHKRRPQEGMVQRRQWIWQEGPRLYQGAPLTAAERALAADFYDSSVAFLDAQLGRLLAGLRSAGRDRDTLVILTSDHGESLGEHGLVGHTNLYDTDLLVPVVMALPGCDGGGRRVATQVRSADILPTVLDLAGLEIPAGLDGTSLLPLVDGSAEGFPREAWSYAATTNYGVALRIDGRLEYIFNNTAWSPVFGREEILAPDGGEPLPEPDPGLRRRLRERVRERLAGRPGNLVLELANAAAVGLEVELRGDGISPERVKGWDLPPPGLAWSGDGLLRCTVTPGSRFELVLEAPGAGEVEVALALGEGERRRTHTATLTLPAGTGFSRRLVDVDGTWSEDAGPDGGLFTGVAAHWLPPAAGTRAEDPAEEDPALREQLRALGYI